MARSSLSPFKQAKLALELHAEPVAEREAAAVKRGLSPREANRLQKTLRANAYRSFTPPDLTVALSALAAGKPPGSLTAIQAGANDGKSDDPIFALVTKHFSKIVLVEPQRQLIPALTQTYADFPGKAIIENVAIGPGGELAIYLPNAAADALYEKRRNLSASRLGSFDRAYVADRLLKATGLSAEEVDRSIDTVVVPCVTLETLADKHLPEGVDLLQIDCEGYDWMVLKTIGKIRPAIINFEWNKLSKQHWAEWQEWAEKNGYGFIKGQLDTLAIRGATF